jgi:toxin CcdB
MTQFCVHKNTSPRARAGKPYLLDLQHALLDELDTRVVAALAPVGDAAEDLGKLTPIVEIDGAKFHVRMYELAVVPKSFLGKLVADVQADRGALIAAYDTIISGV